MKAQSKLLLSMALIVLTANPLLAFRGENRGPKHRDYYGTVRVINQCDEAVSCKVGNQATVVLEPLQSTQVTYGLVDNTPIEVPVTVKLVSDNTVSKQTSMTVESNKTTTATVTSVVSGSTIELQISVTTESKKGKK